MTTIDVLCPTCGGLVRLKAATIGSLWRGRCATCAVTLHVAPGDVVRYVARHGTDEPAQARFAHKVNIDPSRDGLLGSLVSGAFTLLRRNLSRRRVLAKAAARGFGGFRDRIWGCF